MVAAPFCQEKPTTWFILKWSIGRKWVKFSMFMLLHMMLFYLGAIFMYLSKAFGTIDQSFLIVKLSAYGFFAAATGSLKLF